MKKQIRSLRLKTNFKLKVTKRRLAIIQLAIMAFAVLITPLGAYAATGGQVQNRYLNLSSSVAAATSVTYTFGFRFASTTNVGSIKFEICNDPFPETACSNTGASSGINMSGVTTLTQGTQDENNFTLGTGGSAPTTNTVIITRTAAAVTTGQDHTFAFNPITNPTTTNQTFYARVTTYGSTDASGTAIDYGGFAVSTANQVKITAKVQESLTFCIYTGANCAAGGDTITLGDSNGVLSPSTAFTNANAKFDAATNARLGVVIVMKGTTLTSGSNTITAIGDTATASTTGTEQFGMRLGVSGGSVTATAPYNSGTNYAFNDSAVNGTLSAGGDQIASSTGASATTTGTMTFLANISNLTEAGIYTTALTYVATGTF